MGVYINVHVLLYHFGVQLWLCQMGKSLYEWECIQIDSESLCCKCQILLCLIVSRMPQELRVVILGPHGYSRHSPVLNFLTETDET